MTPPFVHVSVLLAETLRALAPHAAGVYLDVTVGGGGHAEAVLEASAPSGRVVGIDRDESALDAAGSRLTSYGDRVTLLHGEMADAERLLGELGIAAVDGLVADLGVSSPQLDQSERGFSLAREGPLDMRMDATKGETARELIERVDERELADILYQLGEERRSRPIARSILRARDAGQLESTVDLRRAVVRVLGPNRGRIDPATRTFQAIRIAVNDELGQLNALLAGLPDLLADEGRAAIISFHSLEDRAVKRAFRDDPRLERVTKKPIIAGEAEAEANPRARSAKLRVARRLAREEAA